MKKRNIINVPQKAFSDFTKKEKAEFKPVKLTWKDEGPTGPVWVEFDGVEEDKFLGGFNNVYRQYKTEKHTFNGVEDTFTSWFTWQQAAKIAKKLGVKLDEI